MLESSEKEGVDVAEWQWKGLLTPPPSHLPLSSPHTPSTCQLTLWITRPYDQDYDGAAADLRSASSPTEHGDLLTPRGLDVQDAREAAASWRTSEGNTSLGN